MFLHYLMKDKISTFVTKCEALPGVVYPGVQDNRSTLNTKTGYDDDDDKSVMIAISMNFKKLCIKLIWPSNLLDLNPVDYRTMQNHVYHSAIQDVEELNRHLIAFWTDTKHSMFNTDIGQWWSRLMVCVWAKWHFEQLHCSGIFGIFAGLYTCKTFFSSNLLYNFFVIGANILLFC